MRAVRRSRFLLSLLAKTAGLILSLEVACASAACVGDCAGTEQVTIANLIVGVSISLGRQPLASCEAFDENGSGGVEISELIRGVNNALRGCPDAATPSPTPGATPTVGGGVAPAGDEVQVNVFTANGQSNPSAAAAGSEFAVAWQSRGEDGDDYGIIARRLDANGQPEGDADVVNETAASVQRAPALATTGDGFVVAWSSYDQDGDGDGVFARLLGGDGAAQGREFAVNQFTTRDQGYASVAGHDSGSFLVVWESTGQDGNGRGIFARRFAPRGAPLGDEFQVNADGAGDQRRPAIAALGGGAFAVAWMSDRADGEGRGIVARRLASDGSALGGEFVVNLTAAGDQAYPDVAAVDGGGFVVAWESDGQDGDGRGVFARFFTDAGAAVGGEFQVNTTTTGNQRRPRVASDGAGGLVATWESASGGAVAVFGQRYDSRARARGGEFAIPTRTGLASRRPVIASAGNGFVVVWEAYPDGDGDGYGIASRRFDLLP